MIKQIIALVVLSIIVVVSMAYTQHVLEWILSAHNWVAETLTQVFSGGQAGDITRKLLALLCIPIVIGAIPVVIYWLAKRSWFPYFMHVVWVTWLAQTAALVIQYKVGA